MKCIKCGYELTGEENFCRNCGNPLKKNDIISDKNIESSNLNDIKSENTNNINNDSKVIDNITLDKKNPSYKIDNTQELSIENSDSSKKIKKILDELKQNKSCTDDNSDKTENSDSSQNIIVKKEYDNNTKKLDELLEKKQKKEEIQKDSTIIVDSTEIKHEKLKQEEQSKNDNSDNSEQKNAVENNVNENEDINKKLENLIELSNKDISESITDDEVYEETDEDGNKSKSGKTILLVLLLLLSICCIVFLVVVNLDLNNKLKNSTVANETLSNKTSNTPDEKGENCNLSCEQLNVSYNGYDFSKINNIIIENNVLSFKYNNLVLKMASKSNVDFLDLKVSKDIYKDLLQKAGYVISSYGTKVVSEREYVFFESKFGMEKNVLIVYTKGNNNDILMFVIENEKNEVNFNDLVIINEFISSTKLNNQSRSTMINYFIEK